jgi:hypothetical protein
LAVFGSKTKRSVAFFTDSSTMLKKRRTETYLHSLLFPSNVLAPQTNVPFPVKVLIALIDFPAVGSTLSRSCSLLEILTAGASTS